MTIHRPSNVDDPAALQQLCEVLGWLSTQLEVFFPVHTRTRRRLQEFEFVMDLSGVHLLPPIRAGDMEGRMADFLFLRQSPCVYDTLGEGDCLCPIPLSN